VLNTQDEQPSGQMDMMQAPDPVGHFMLVALPEVEIRTKSGIYIPDTVSDRERAASVVGTVIAMGPDCYKDPEPKLPTDLPPGTPITVLAARPRFPSGPWCKQGDTVLFSRYAGKRFTIEGVEFRMLSDDEITATIPDGAKVGGL
jgi:co-chaperonin GroES (HSP10)